MSRLFIYLKESGPTYTSGFTFGPKKTTITVKRETYPGNSLFVRVSHKIEHNTEFTVGGTYLIHDGTKFSKGRLLFRYTNVWYLLDRVDGYYSLQNPDKILLMSFKYQDHYPDKRTFYYAYNDHTGTESVAFELISRSTFSLVRGQGPGNKTRSHREVTEKLTSQNSKVNPNFNKKIKFTIGESSMQNVKKIENDTGNFTSISFIPNANGERLSDECKLSISQLFKSGTNNSIGDASLTSLNGQQFDLITLYYPNCAQGTLTPDHALLIELVKDGQRTHITRANLKGERQWDKARSTPNYSTNDQLWNILEEIRIGLINPVKICSDRWFNYMSDKSTIFVTSEPYSGCLDFEKVVHEIKYSRCLYYPKYCLNLCRSNKTLFRYCFTNPLTSVEFFFWKYNKSDPLVVRFVGQGSTTRYYKYKDLKEGKCTSSLPQRSFGYILLKLLLFITNNQTNKKIKFTTSTFSKDVKNLQGYLVNFSIISLIANLTDQLSPCTSTLSKDKLFRTKTDDKNAIDEETLRSLNDKQFNNINVFYPTNANGNISKDHAIFVEFVNNCKKTHIRRISLVGKGLWEKTEPIQYSTNKVLLDMLNTIAFSLNNPITMLIDKQVAYTKTEVQRLINSSPKDSQPENIPVTEQTLGFTGFKYFEHDITPSITTSVPRIGENGKQYLILELLAYIGNIRITIKDSVGSADHHIFYRHGINDKFYVYFYGRDPRPLLIFYNKNVYKPKSLSEYTKTWVQVNGLSMSKCPTSCTDYKLVIKTLEEIYDFLNPVQIYTSVPISSGKHSKSSNSISISTVTTRAFTENKCYLKLKHTANPGHRLGNIMYESKCVKIDGTEQPITAAGFSEVVVFYKAEDETHQYPLLIVTKKDVQDDISYQTCYELTNSSDKLYRRTDRVVTLDDALIPILDRINLSVLNKLIIILENQQLYNPQLSPALTTSQSDSSDNHQLKVSKHDCPSLLLSSFKCYKHEVTNYSKIADVGGLKFQLWDEKETQPLYIDGKPKFTYTKCKGDIYVFFYGDDPRPLLFCYDKKTYRPESKDNYNTKWVEVDALSIRDCPTSCSNHKRLLDTLKGVADFMNPVQIEKSVSTVTRGNTVATSYQIHRVDDEDINIILIRDTISNCYTKFTHKRNDGYRLGTLTYGEEPITDESQTPISAGDYDEVIVFYKEEDKSHKYPLLIIMKKSSDVAFKFYYKLSRNSEKIYKKLDKTIDLKEKTLVPILDHINHSINRYLKIILSKQREYTPGLLGNIDKPPPEPPPRQHPDTLEVTIHRFPPIVDSPFTYFIHRLTKYSNLPEVSGLKMNIDDGRELQLRDTKNKTVTFTYTKCKGELYVYFYLKSTSINIGTITTSSAPDCLPLLFYFNDKWYRPPSKDRYLTTWAEVSDLKGIPGPYHTAYHYKVENELDKINKMLNTILLHKTSNASYGISRGCLDINEFNPQRVNVQIEKKKWFARITHSTTNGGPIGNIVFMNPNMIEGIYCSDYNSYGINQVDVFYLRFDTEFTYPIIIALLIDGKCIMYYYHKSGSIYSFKKVGEKLNLERENDIRAKMYSIVKEFNKNDMKLILELYKRWHNNDGSKYDEDIAELEGELSFDLMKTIIPVGGTYLVAGASIYPASAFIHSFLAMI